LREKEKQIKEVNGKKGRNRLIYLVKESWNKIMKD